MLALGAFGGWDAFATKSGALACKVTLLSLSQPPTSRRLPQPSTQVASSSLAQKKTVAVPTQLSGDQWLAVIQQTAERSVRSELSRLRARYEARICVLEETLRQLRDGA